MRHRGLGEGRETRAIDARVKGKRGQTKEVQVVGVHPKTSARWGKQQWWGIYERWRRRGAARRVVHAFNAQRVGRR
jgi:hypothetical protein